MIEEIEVALLRDSEESYDTPWYEELWWNITYYTKEVWNWFRYRFIPKHRYHTIRLHDPEYRDPRSQLINAMMAMVERYVHELRVNWHPDDLSDESDFKVVHRYLEWYEGMREDPNIMIDPDGWVDHYEKLLDVIIWWDKVQDSWDLDTWSVNEFEYFSDDEIDGYLENPELKDEITCEKVNEMLKKVVELRTGMWV